MKPIFTFAAVCGLAALVAYEPGEPNPCKCGGDCQVCTCVTGECLEPNKPLPAPVGPLPEVVEETKPAAEPTNAATNEGSKEPSSDSPPAITPAADKAAVPPAPLARSASASGFEYLPWYDTHGRYVGHRWTSPNTPRWRAQPAMQSQGYQYQTRRERRRAVFCFGGNCP